ncbi:MAG TPA: DNA-directed RNA polymerase subunit alpha [bacterium]
MQIGNVQIPKFLDYEKESLTPTYGKFIAEPFERGYGQSVGNSLRRILLSSITGAAVTSVKFEGVSHEYSSIPGVVEDTTEIILNLKELKIKLVNPGSKTLRLSVKGERNVVAADIQTDANVEILNPQLHLATLTEEDAVLDLEIEVAEGRGYAPAERNKQEGQSIGVIPVDSIFTPVTQVKYSVESARIGQMTDYDKLIMEIWTDGRIHPEDSLAHASKILRDSLQIFINFEEEPIQQDDSVSEEEERLRELLNESVEELELSVRSANCLKTANIKTIGDLVRKTESDMLKYKNFGRKSLNEIKEILVGMGLSFGMDVDSILEKGKPVSAARVEANV